MLANWLHGWLATKRDTIFALSPESDSWDFVFLCHFVNLPHSISSGSYKAAISNFDLSNAKTQDRWQPIKKCIESAAKESESPFEMVDSKTIYNSCGKCSSSALCGNLCLNKSSDRPEPGPIRFGITCRAAGEKVAESNA